MKVLSEFYFAIVMDRAFKVCREVSKYVIKLGVVSMAWFDG